MSNTLGLNTPIETEPDWQQDPSLLTAAQQRAVEVVATSGMRLWPGLSENQIHALFDRLERQVASVRGERR